MINSNDSIPLSITLLREKGFIIPRHPIHENSNIKFIGTINRICHSKKFGIIKLTKKCPPIAIIMIDNREVFIIYTPYPKTITHWKELKDYCKELNL